MRMARQSSCPHSTLHFIPNPHTQLGNAQFIFRVYNLHTSIYIHIGKSCVNQSEILQFSQLGEFGVVILSFHCPSLYLPPSITVNLQYQYVRSWHPLLRLGACSVCAVLRLISQWSLWSIQGIQTAWCCYVCSCVPRSGRVAWSPGRTVCTCMRTVPGAAVDVTANLHTCWSICHTVNSGNHGDVPDLLTSYAGTKWKISVISQGRKDRFQIGLLGIYVPKQLAG